MTEFSGVDIFFLSTYTVHITPYFLFPPCSSGIAASVGAACHGNATTVSSVLLAFGVDAADAATAIRISVGRDTTKQQVLRAVALLKDSYDQLYSPKH